MSYMELIGSAVEAGGTAAQGFFSYLSAREQAEGQVGQVKEFMKHKAYHERKAASDMRKQLTSAKVTQQATAVSNLEQSRLKTERTQTIVYTGIGLGIAITLGAGLWLVLRR